MHNLSEGSGPHQGAPQPRQRPSDLIDEERLLLHTARGQWRRRPVGLDRCPLGAFLLDSQDGESQESAHEVPYKCS